MVKVAHSAMHLLSIPSKQVRTKKYLWYPKNSAKKIVNIGTITMVHKSSKNRWCLKLLMGPYKLVTSSEMDGSIPSAIELKIFSPMFHHISSNFKKEYECQKLFSI